MVVNLWIIMSPSADRPYVSTTPPTPERYKELRAKGCKVYRADVLVPGWHIQDGVVEPAIAQEVGES